MNPLEAAKKYCKGYDDQWMCLVPRPEAITENSTLLSDHESRNVCACEFEAAFLAGAAYERERVEGLVATLESISSHYGQRPDDRELARVYEDMANDALKKWRQHDSE